MTPLGAHGPLTDAERFLFDVAGYLIIPDALSPEETAACLEAAKRVHAPHPKGEWRQLGNTGWSFEDVLPYFRKAEDQQRGATRLHGSGGPLAVSDVKPHKLCEAFIEACEEAGHPRGR